MEIAEDGWKSPRFFSTFSSLLQLHVSPGIGAQALLRQGGRHGGVHRTLQVTWLGKDPTISTGPTGPWLQVRKPQ